LKEEDHYEHLRLKWEDNIKMDVREIEMRVDWTDLAQDGDQWWTPVSKICEQFGSIKY
jgi:hypothetical protein